MHGDVNHPAQDSKYLIESLQALLKLNVLVPERVGQEVQPNAGCAALEEPANKRTLVTERVHHHQNSAGEMGVWEGKEGE